MGISGSRTKAAVAISCINRWPAVRLAVSRTPRATGRIKRLAVSMRMRAGIRGTGVPSGRRCPKAAVGFFRSPMMTVISQSGTARAMFKESCVVGVNVYGRSPSMLMEIRNTINDVNIRAHLCPPMFSGRRSCCVNRLMNQPCRVRRRLFIQREVGAGKRVHGRRRAMAINGMPKSVGLRNWSKKLSVMVRFRT